MLGIEPGYQGAELAQVARLCAQVSGMIRSKRPLIDVWLAAGRVDPDVVGGVAAQVVARAKTAIAIGGVAAQSEQNPRYMLAAASAALSLSAEELALLTPPVDERGAFTIRPGVAV